MVFYASVYVLFLMYTLYNLFALKNGKICAIFYIKHKFINQIFLDIIENTYHEDLVEGWSILHRKKDGMDNEWWSIQNFLSDNALWFLLHLLVTEIARQIDKMVIKIDFTHT